MAVVLLSENHEPTSKCARPAKRPLPPPPRYICFARFRFADQRYLKIAMRVLPILFFFVFFLFFQYHNLQIARVRKSIKKGNFIGHWWLHDLDIAAQSYDRNNAQHNLMMAQIGKSCVTYIRVITFEPSSKYYICVYISYLYV